jgi:hypothetical protein
MNSHPLANLSVLATIPAALMAPVSFKAAATAFTVTVTGILAVVLADHGRGARPVRARGVLVPFEGAGRAQFDEAA